MSCKKIDLVLAMRKSPRQGESRAVLGPESQGETAFSPLDFLIAANRKSKSCFVVCYKTSGFRIAQADRIGSVMDCKCFADLLAVFALLLSTPSRAQESIVTYKSLTPEIALDLARAALADCQHRGYQVAVAVVDRAGVIQVVLRDRYLTRPPLPPGKRGPPRPSATVPAI
jgi:hypothetical protein